MSDVILNSVIIWIEVLILVQCLEISFRKAIPADRYLALFTVGIYLVYAAINFGGIKPYWSILVYAAILYFCHVSFRQSLPQTLIKAIFGITVCGLMETVVVFFVPLFFQGEEVNSVLALSALIVLFLVKMLRDISLNPSGGVKTKGRNLKWIFASLSYLVFMLLLIDYYLNLRPIKIYVVLILALILSALLFIQRMERTQAELEKREYELELQRIYEGTFEELIKKIRKRQHDYKNQLGAIYSMHLAAESLEDLISMQREYADKLQMEAKYDAILLSCNNRILACYLYSRCSQCENKGIGVDYDIHLDKVECCFSIHELVEILGILIDNACESIEKENIRPKCIRLKAYEEREKLTFSVANPVYGIEFPEIDRLFQYGYSSKGKGRGIGLARVLELVNKYEAKIMVSQLRENQEEWIGFTLEIA
ncbi:MAG: sensor histidine kinase [Lachnospiraceae bacterium]